MAEVEVIVPVFNDQIRLNRLLACLAGQTLSPLLFGVIVVDNGSDEPVELPGDLPFKCRLISCSIPGSYAARNVAWPVTQAPWVAFTDSDCLPHATWLEAGLRATRIESEDECPRLLAGRIEMIPSSYERLTPADLVEIYFGMSQERYVRRGGYGVTANLWIESFLLEELGGFNSSCKSGSDRDFCLRAKRGGVGVTYVKECLVCHPARNREELACKARRLIGGRVDAAGSGFLSRLMALVMHSRPLLRETWVCFRLPLSLMQRFQMFCLMVDLRLVALHEWCSLVFFSSPSQR